MEKNVVKAVKLALERMDPKYCTLSQIDYSTIEGDHSFVNNLKEEKYLERPFAYEFYHRLREMMDKAVVDFGGPIIQAEVNKKYQHCFEKGKIPDFIIHVPNTSRNLAVIEFKLTTNLSKIKSDFQKIIKFKKKRKLKYNYAIQVIIGDSKSLGSVMTQVKKSNKSHGEEIIIIDFNTDSWKASHSFIKEPNLNVQEV